MEIITLAEFQSCLGKAFYDSWDNGTWRLFSTRFLTEPHAGRLNGLAQKVSNSLGKTGGSILIVENTSIFPSSEDLYLAETFRLAFGEKRSIREAPAHIFAAEDSKIFWSMMHICLISFWDFFIVSGDRQVCVCGSHDEVIDIFALKEEYFTRIRNLILPLKLKEVSPSGHPPAVQD